VKHFSFVYKFKAKYQEKKFKSILRKIDKQITSTQLGDIPNLFEKIPLDTFGHLLLDIPEEYPNLKSFFPVMPPDSVQDSWTGSHGVTLLNTSLAFIKTLTEGYIEITEKDLHAAKILDYGCGWGRLIRLLYKFVSIENIYGVDPWQKSIDLCKQYGIKANLMVSDYVPTNLPFEKKFDIIFAFSVFTHLSEKTAKVVLKTLKNYLSEDGLLIITIRPKEYWSIHQQGKFMESMNKLHDEKGYAFIPHNREPIEGDITYGDASISMDYFRENIPQWKIIKEVTNRVDFYQKILFLQPV